MGSIRPLVTITLLVVVGAYLYVKINEGPMPSRAGKGSASSEAPEGIPPLATTKSAALAADSKAPAWPSSTPSAVSPPPIAAPAASIPSPAASSANSPSQSDPSKTNLPAVPAIPELPQIPTASSDALSNAQPSVVLPKDLPADIPTARYPNEPPQNAKNDTAKNEITPVPLTANSVANSTTPTEFAKTNPPASTDRAGSDTPPLAKAPAELPQGGAQNPLRPIQSEAAAPKIPDRYATPAPASPSASQLVPLGPAPNQSPAPTETSFTASWPTIQATLDRGDLKQAHQLLSKWRGNDSLTPSDAQRVESLLSQLAGTVIYSTEHQLEPPRVVQQGESLESIAKEYNVPWQLLAKINGVQSPDQIRPNQQLKVVRGPFAAVVDLRHNEMTLSVDDRYAGKFAVTVPPGTTLVDGQWVVDQKLAGSASTANPSAYATTPIPAERTIILRNASPTAAPGTTPTLLIACGPAPAGIAANPPAIRVSLQDAEELSDILSIGSRVIVRR